MCDFHPITVKSMQSHRSVSSYLNIFGVMDNIKGPSEMLFKNIDMVMILLHGR